MLQGMLCAVNASSCVTYVGQMYYFLSFCTHQRAGGAPAGGDVCGDRLGAETHDST